MPPLKWLPPGTDPTETPRLFASAGNPDMHANYAVLLCARTCALLSERTRHTELGERGGLGEGPAFESAWRALWDELQRWSDTRPPDFVPVRTVETSPFPEILFARWSAISSNQLHHTACVLMLDMVPTGPLRAGLGWKGSALWHAKRVCGISAANPHHGCLNNAVQPLWAAGRLLSHREEHRVLVRLIWEIEALTGWGTSWRIADLEACWGYRVPRHAS